MAMGAPVISADCLHGPSEIITDNKDGRLVPVGDFEQLASAISDLIDSPALREQLSSRARMVRIRYDQDKIMALWENILFGLPRRAQQTS